MLEWCIILTWSQYFVTDDLQFGFKHGYSTTLCTGIIKAGNCYIKRSSNIYACLIDVSKAFDTVDHYVLFEKLITKSIPILIARYLLYLVSIREVCLAQSCLLSMSTVFCVLCVNQVVVVTGTVYLQVHYATLTILAPSADGLRKMLEVCEEFGCSHHICFNPWFGSTVNFPCNVSFI